MQANCSICLEDIGTGNSVITECGHPFHANCLMQNVAFNGFGCPYCRTIMANVPAEYSESVESESDDLEEYILRGFRFFDNQLNGEQHTLEDIREELNYTGSDVKPTIEEITEKIIEDGVTIQHFVKAMLKDIREYEEDEEEYDRLDDELFEKIRNVVIQYQLTA